MELLTSLLTRLFISLEYIRSMLSIKELIARGESQTLEFKFELNSARRIASTISAFSNAGGGTILVGVKDNGAIAGIRLEEEIYVLDAAASMYCNSPVKMEIRRREAEGKLILEAFIPAAISLPVKAETEPGEWKAWIRCGASNRLATPVHLELWRLNNPDKNPPAHFSEKELRVLHVFQEKKWLSLNQATKWSKLPRHIVARTLANFIRWEIINIELEESGGFLFLLRDEKS